MSNIIEQTVISEIGRSLSAALELDELLEMLYNQIGRLFDTTNFYIATYTEGSDEWYAAFQVEHNERQPNNWHKVSSGLVGYIIRHRQPVFMRNLEENMAFHGDSDVPLMGQRARSWMGVPLIAAGRVVGAMALQSYEHDDLYSEQDFSLFATIADQVANAIENARLYLKVHSRAERLAVVNRIGSAVGAILDLDDFIETVYQEIAAIFKPDVAFIAFYHAESKEIEFVLRWDRGERLPPDRRPLGESLTTSVIIENKPLLVRDFEAEKDDLPEVRLWGTESPPSWLGVPIRIGSRVLGVISVQAFYAYAYSKEDQLLLATIADQVSLALNNQQLYAQEQQRRRQAEFVSQIGQLLVSTLDLDAVLPAVMERIAQAIDVPQCGVVLFDQRAGVGRLIAEHPHISEQDAQDVQIPIAGNASLEKIIKTREPLNIFDVQNDPLLASVQDVLAASNIKSVLIVPMLAGGRLIGTIGFDSIDRQRCFTDQEITTALTVASQLAAAIDNTRLLQEEQQARQLLGGRVKALDCLNDIGREIDVTPPIPEFLSWLAQRVPAAVQRPDLCIVAVQYRDQVYGDEQAASLPRHIVGGLRVSGELVGRVYIAYLEERDFVDQESALLGGIVRRVSGYIENRHLFEQTRQQLADLTAIQETTVLLTEAQTFDEAVEQFLPKVIDAVQADQSSMFLVRGEEMIRIATHSLGEHTAKVGQILRLDDYPATRKIIETQQPMVVTTNDPQLQPHVRESFQGSGIVANAVIPLVGREGTLGTLDISSRRPGHAFSERDVNLMQTLAGQAAIAFERVRLFEGTTLLGQRQMAISEIVGDMIRQTYLNALLMVVTDGLVIKWNVALSRIWFLEQDERGDVLVLVASSGISERLDGEHARKYLDEHTKIALVAQARMPKFSTDLLNDAAFVDPDWIQQEGIQSFAGYPLFYGDRGLGVLGVFTPDLLSEAEFGMLGNLATQLASVAENQWLLARAQTRAQREQVLRQITARLRGSNNPDTIVRSAVRELGTTLGRSVFVRLGSAEELGAPRGGE